MKYLITIVCCLISLTFYGQNLSQGIYFTSGPASPWRASSTEEVAQWIQGRYQTENEKYLAAYNWVTKNIRYDRDSSFIINAGADENAKIEAAFRRRRGVCENFAAIFNDICNKAGLQTYVVQGYTRSESGVQDDGHTWVAGTINGEWYLFDPTWDAGEGSRFYKVPPAEFIQTHMPFDPIWQLLEYPVSNADFNRGIFSRSWTKNKLNYKDSIAAFLQKKQAVRMLDTEKRMSEAGLENKLLKTNYSVVRMHIEMQRQEEQVNWHDSAIALVNRATEGLNGFIKAHNSGNLTAASTRHLDLSLQTLKEAEVYLSKIDKSKATLVMGTWPVRERIEELRKKIAGLM